MNRKIRKLDFDEIQAMQLSVEEENRSVRLPVVVVLENVRSL